MLSLMFKELTTLLVGHWQCYAHNTGRVYSSVCTYTYLSSSTVFMAETKTTSSCGPCSSGVLMTWSRESGCGKCGVMIHRYIQLFPTCGPFARTMWFHRTPVCANHFQCMWVHYCFYHSLSHNLSASWWAWQLNIPIMSLHVCACSTHGSQRELCGHYNNMKTEE